MDDLSITEYCEQHDLTADKCVSEMRRIVQEETKLTVSAGIASNRVCTGSHDLSISYDLNIFADAR